MCQESETQFFFFFFQETNAMFIVIFCSFLAGLELNLHRHTGMLSQKTSQLHSLLQFWDFKQIIGWGFWDIRNNQGRRKCNPASADYTCWDLDYSGYHKNQIQYCFIIHCFMENIQILLCEMQEDFIRACKNIRTKVLLAAASLKTIQVLTLFNQRCALRTHGIICRYN